MSDVYIAGVCLTPFGKDFRSIGVMLADACQKALQDSLAFTSVTPLRSMLEFKYLKFC